MITLKDIRDFFRIINFKLHNADELDDYRFLPEVRKVESTEALLEQEVVFIVSPGRSGTKTFIEELKESTDLLALHAPKPWLASIGYKRYYKKISDEASFWSFYSTREKYLQLAYEKGKILVDGDCKNLPLLEDIAKYMPNSKFIHIIRKPDSFIKSGLHRGYFSEKKPELWGHLSRMDVCCDDLDLLERAKCIAQFWEISNEIALNLKNKVSDERFVSVKAENMFENGEYISEALKNLNLGKTLRKSITGSLKVRNKNKSSSSIKRDQIQEEELGFIIESLCPSYKKFYG